MGGGGTQTVEKQSDPWLQQQPYLTDVFGQAQKQYNQPGPFYYPGSTVAPLDPATTEAWGMLKGAVPQQQALGINAATANNALLGAVDVTNNPYLDKAIAAAQRPLQRQFYDPGGPLAQTRSDAIMADQYGGSRQGIAQGVAKSRLDETLADISSRMASTAYGQGLEAAGRGVALAPVAQQAQAQPAITMDAAGQAARQYNQDVINAAIQQWNYNQTLPYQKLAQYQNLIQGQYGMTGSTTGSGAKGSPVAGALGGAATGAGLAGLLMSTGAINGWNPYGWVALAAGGLLGALSSQS